MRSSALRSALGLACGLVIAVAANDAAAGPTGACCIGTDCFILTEPECLAQNGLYQGDGTTCGGQPITYESFPNAPLPDADPAGVSDTITVPDSVVITDVDVALQVTHTWVGDLCVTLVHQPTGTTVDLIQRMGAAGAFSRCHPEGPFGCALNNFNIVLDDTGTGGPIESQCMAGLSSPPNYVPNNPLAAFNGLNSAGDWTLTVSDNAGADLGTFDSWALIFPGPGKNPCAGPVGACCIGADCVVLPEDQCLDQGGHYQGDGTDCGVAGYVATTCGNAFEDISGTGTQLPLTDDDGEFVPLGFSFNFFGDDHTDIAVSSNGYLTFGTDLTDFTNDPIPTTTLPNDFIAPLWDDFNPAAGGTVHYQTLGTVPNRRFIAQWTNVPQFGGVDSNTFQAILGEATNCIQFRYGAFTPEAFAGDYTVGVENQNGTDGLGLDASMLSPGDCVSICPAGGICQPQCPWDLDGGGSVGILDLLALLAAWGPQPPGHPADFDGNDNVGILDLLILLANWGPCP